MEYNLNKPAPKIKNWTALKNLLGLMTHERPRLIAAFVMMMMNSGLNLLGPLLGAIVINRYIVTAHPNYPMVLQFGLLFLGMYVIALFTGYMQTRLMAGF